MLVDFLRWIFFIVKNAYFVSKSQLKSKFSSLNVVSNLQKKMWINNKTAHFTQECKIVISNILFANAQFFSLLYLLHYCTRRKHVTNESKLVSLFLNMFSINLTYKFPSRIIFETIWQANFVLLIHQHFLRLNGLSLF